MSFAGSRRTKVFVSYSHKDEEWIKPLGDHLSGLGDDALWIDTDAIQPGEKWDEEIAAGLVEARVAVLLISAGYLASRYVRDKELPYLLEAADKREITLLPVYVRPCDIPPDLAAYQAVNGPDEIVAKLDGPAQDEVWIKTLRKIRKELSQLVLATVASEDREAAEQVLQPLETMDLHFDLEAYDRDDDPSLRELVATKLSQRQATLIFLGQRGLGLWQDDGLRRALRKTFVTEGAPDQRLLAALLPGTPDDLRMPDFLPDNVRIRFPRGLADPATLDRIRIGLTGVWQRPRRPATSEPEPGPALPAEPAAPEPAGELSTAAAEIDHLAGRLAFENLTVFLGDDVAPAGGGDAPAEEMLPLRPYELTRGLLGGLDLDGPDLDRLLLPPNVAGTYYAVSKGERKLETKVCDMVNSRSGLTPTHRQIARLLARLHELEGSGRIARRGQRPVRLIVTTNIDLLMERALLLAEVPFVRLVQDRLGEKIVANEYRSVTSPSEGWLAVQTGQDQREVRASDVDELSEIIAELGHEEFVYRTSATDVPSNPLGSLPLERFEPQVLLYKFHGSEDVRGSCAISVDQHFRLLKAVLEKNVIPLKITEVLSGGPVLLFGYGLLDPPFRMLFHSLPIETGSHAGSDDRRYLLQLPPADDDPDEFRRLEQRLWSRIKSQAENCGIAVVEKRGDLFLEELIRGLERRWEGGHATHG